VEVTLPADTPLAGRPVRQLQLPANAALVTILRGSRVIIPQDDDPLEGGDELLFVAAAEVEPEVRAALGTASPRQRS
jgi:trk system potassium uptake protein TrkA